MATLLVKKLDEKAKLPTVAHPGEDLAYDLYALEDTVVNQNEVTRVRTGIAVACFDKAFYVGEVPLVVNPYGLIIKDRSSMALGGITTHGGVVDSGYRGEIQVLMSRKALVSTIKAGEKIAQMIPVPVETGAIKEVNNLPEANRGEKGFGSSGK